MSAAHPRVLGAVLIALIVAGCSGRDRLTVYAAASLAPYLDCSSATCSFEASSRLARKIEAGARVDVLVSADRRWVEYLQEKGLVTYARVVAKNALVLVVPRGRHLGANPRIAIASQNAPAGRYAMAALGWAGLRCDIVEAPNVRAALAWAKEGVVDGAVVYLSDWNSARDSVDLERRFPPEAHPPIEYVAAVTTAAPHPQRARKYVDSLAGSIPGLLTPDGIPVKARTSRGTGVSVTSAIVLSAAAATSSTLLSLPFAVALGWLLSRRRFRGKALVLVVVMAPMVMPPVVTGYLLLELLKPTAPVGTFLAGLGIRVPFTLLGASVAAAVVGFPLLTLSARSAFDSVDSRPEGLAMTMGRRPWQVFTTVTLPLALPGIAAGALLSFARAMGEFGATAVLAGNVEGRTRTIPLAIYTLLESPDSHGLYALVWASIAISLAALVGYEALVSRSS